ncbi:MAG: NAD(P)/FAD-dependent oxidoreductase [Sphingomonadaceae bacterium]
MICPTRNADVVVVGGGIIGAACGYYLAREGLSVLLLERSFLASGSSGACEGNLLLWDKELERELPLAQRSLQLWRELAGELGIDFEYDPKGSIMLAEDEAALAAVSRKLSDLSAAGVAGEMLDPRQLHAEEPALADDLAGGALFPEDAQVEPRIATTALIDSGRRHGLVVRQDAAVRRVALGPDGRVEAVETDRERIPTGAVVVAAGVWTREVAATAGLDVPVYPRKGQIVVVERAPYLFRRKLMEAGYTSAVESDSAGLQVATVAESTRGGTLLLGSSRELVGFDRSVNLRVAAAITARALRFFPSLGELRSIRNYAGLRPFSPDHLPLIGPLSGAKGFYVATGHEGAGIGLAPATGRLIAQWVTGQTLDFPAGWFSPDRFVHRS